MTEMTPDQREVFRRGAKTGWTLELRAAASAIASAAYDPTPRKPRPPAVREFQCAACGALVSVPARSGPYKFCPNCSAAGAGRATWAPDRDRPPPPMDLRRYHISERVPPPPWLRKTLRADPCCFCGARPAGAADHIVAVASGGEDGPENRVGICQDCNVRKEDGSLLLYLVARCIERELRGTGGTERCGLLMRELARCRPPAVARARANGTLGGRPRRLC